MSREIVVVPDAKALAHRTTDSERALSRTNYIPMTGHPVLLEKLRSAARRCGDALSQKFRYVKDGVWPCAARMATLPVRSSVNRHFLHQRPHGCGQLPLYRPAHIDAMSEFLVPMPSLTNLRLHISRTHLVVTA